MERLAPAPTGIGVTKVEDGSGLYEVGGYFEAEPDAAGLAVLAAAFGARPFAVSELPDVDWVAHVRRELAPVEAGRFFVHGSHDAGKVPAGKIGLLIEAAMAFGTGHHGTTLGCLRALDWLIDEGFRPERLADIGCGTAVLSMAASAQWGVAAIASDADPVAVDVAQCNVNANGLSELVTCLEATGFGHPVLDSEAPFDLIFANILKGPLIALAPDIAAASNNGGKVILSGILNAQAAEILKVYFDLGFNHSYREEIVDWTTLLLTKRN